MGVGRMNRFEYITDLPNAQLDSNFRDAVEQLVQGRMAPSDMRTRYGTHFASAITYGCLFHASKTVTNSEVSKKLDSKFNAGVQVSGAEGANAHGSYGEADSQGNLSGSIFSKRDFDMVGGSGATADMAQCDSPDAVPILYDLHPLSELISPVFFPTGGDQTKAGAYAQARAQLKAEIDRYMATGPAFSTVSTAPRFYLAEFTNVSCKPQGSWAGTRITLIGSIDFGFDDDGGAQSVTVFSDPNGTATTCAVNISIPTPVKKLLTLSPSPPPGADSSFGQFFIATADQLYAYTNSAGDPLGKFIEQNTHYPIQTSAYGTLASQADGTVRHAILSVGDGAPTLDVQYRISEVHP